MIEVCEDLLAGVFVKSRLHLHFQNIGVDCQIMPTQMLATSSLQPHPATSESSNLAMPALSQIFMTTFLTARTCSRFAPPFIAPLRWPFSCGFT